jgi:hypothetical protein
MVLIKQKNTHRDERLRGSLRSLDHLTTTYVQVFVNTELGVTRTRGRRRRQGRRRRRKLEYDELRGRIYESSNR